MNDISLYLGYHILRMFVLLPLLCYSLHQLSPSAKNFTFTLIRSIFKVYQMGHQQGKQSSHPPKMSDMSISIARTLSTLAGSAQSWSL